MVDNHETLHNLLFVLGFADLDTAIVCQCSVTTVQKTLQLAILSIGNVKGHSRRPRLLLADGVRGPGEGKALVSFRVNKSPSHGMATILPREGTELLTQFKAFISQWRDEEGVSTSDLLSFFAF